MKLPLLPLLAAFAFTIGTAAAQTQPATSSAQGQGREHRQVSPEERATRRSEQMTKELGLNADQSGRIKQILLTRDQEMQAMRGQGKPDGATREQMGAQMKANREKYDAQFKEVLTADQYTKYTAMVKDHKRDGRGPGKDGAGAKGEKVKAKNGKVKVKSTES
jgi:protein CpxP